MIEAVNATISTAATARAIAQQVSTVESLSANPSRLQKAAIQTEYSSKYIELAPDIKPIFVVRDTSTGESIRQFPSEGQIRAYQRAQQVRENVLQANSAKAPEDASMDQAVLEVESSVQYAEVRKQIRETDAPPAPLPGQGGSGSGEVKADLKIGGSGNFDAPASAGGPGSKFSADI